MSNQIIGLHHWFDSPPGRYLLAWEQERFDEAVVDIFGFHGLQLGIPMLDGLRANRMPHHWLALGEKADPDKLPGIYFVNWFRKGDDGKFVWPGFGDNARVLKWISERLDG